MATQPIQNYYNSEAERAVLSSALSDTDSLQAAMNILKPEDFYNADNAKIFQSMLTLKSKYVPVDAVTLNGILSETTQWDSKEILDKISILIGSYYMSANTEQHALEIKKLSESRKIHRLLNDLIQKQAPLNVDDVKTVLTNAESERYIKSHADKAQQNIDDYRGSMRKVKPRITTGLSRLDLITGGFRKPSVAIIGAFPSCGKTSLALNIASNQKEPVIFFSLEMSAEMIYERLAADKLKIDYGLFTEQLINNSQYEEIESFMDKLKERNFHVFDDEYYIERHEQIINNIKPCLVVVDYIQIVRTRHKADSRRTEIDYISSTYKQIAKNNKCVMLLLSQLSRPESRSAKTVKPTMASLKESGSLEADGDYVGILHRPYVIDKESPEVRPEDAYLLIDKNKFGNTGKLDLYFEGKYQRFYEADYSTQSYTNNQPKPPSTKKHGQKMDGVYKGDLPFM